MAMESFFPNVPGHQTGLGAQNTMAASQAQYKVPGTKLRRDFVLHWRLIPKQHGTIDAVVAREVEVLHIFQR
jgi:hypothetical protein